MRFILAFIVLFGLIPCSAQNMSGKLDLEITKAKIGINVGPYRGRSKQTNGPFNQGIAGFGQIYLPFQLIIDYRSNFSDSSTIINEYNKRRFLLRSSALIHIVDNRSYAFGIGIQVSFLIVCDFYIEYQIGAVYLEASKNAGPDIYNGFNLHHVASISKPIGRHFSISMNYIHMSGGGIGNGKVSNQDIIALGIKWNL
jgi:hypothetical protein